MFRNGDTFIIQFGWSVDLEHRSFLNTLKRILSKFTSAKSGNSHGALNIGCTWVLLSQNVVEK